MMETAVRVVQRADVIPLAGRAAFSLEKKRRFVEALGASKTQVQAVLDAGITTRRNSAGVIATRYMKDPVVRQMLADQADRRLKKADLKAVRVLEELRRLAFADIRDLFDNDWRLKHADDISDEAASILAAVERTTSGTRSTVKVKIQSKLHALELLARHFALLTDVVRVEDDQARIAALHAGRARAAAAKAARDAAGK
jgi:phage terminase small subunit